MNRIEIIEKIKQLVKEKNLPDKFITIYFNDITKEYLYSSWISERQGRFCRFSKAFLSKYLKNSSVKNKIQLIKAIKKGFIVTVQLIG